jgi:hypothetical protein
LSIVIYEPTAVQSVADGQDTDRRRAPNVEPQGLGVGWTVQVAPSHLSANVRRVLLLLVSYPTAVQAEADEQDTPVRKL